MTLVKQSPKGSIDLPEREWNFAACPKDEVYDCWLYEFAREIAWLKDIVERGRNPVTLRNGRQVQLDTLTRFARRSFYSFLLRPDWPAQPYLSALPEERQKWIAWTRLKPEQEIYAEFLIPSVVPKAVDKNSLLSHWRILDVLVSVQKVTAENLLFSKLIGQCRTRS